VSVLLGIVIALLNLTYVTCVEIFTHLEYWESYTAYNAAIAWRVALGETLNVIAALILPHILLRHDIFGLGSDSSIKKINQTMWNSGGLVTDF
jgi:hypothetical protein